MTLPPSPHTTAVEFAAIVEKFRGHSIDDEQRSRQRKYRERLSEDGEDR